MFDVHDVQTSFKNGCPDVTFGCKPFHSTMVSPTFLVTGQTPLSFGQSFHDVNLLAGRFRSIQQQKIVLEIPSEGRPPFNTHFEILPLFPITAGVSVEVQEIASRWCMNHRKSPSSDLLQGDRVLNGT